MLSVSALFDQHIGKISPEPNSGCWLWTGNANGGGYGRLKINRRRFAAHRVFYAAAHGEIPNDLHIDHRCRVVACVNPDHLEAVTQQENNRRQHFALRKIEHQRPNVCANGHEWSPQTSYTHSYGHRACLICQRAANVKSKRRARQGHRAEVL